MSFSMPASTFVVFQIIGSERSPVYLSLDPERAPEGWPSSENHSHPQTNGSMRFSQFISDCFHGTPSVIMICCHWMPLNP